MMSERTGVMRRFNWPLLLLLLLLLLLHATGAEAHPLTCSYETYSWNVHLKRAVNIAHIRHPYSRMSRQEVDPLTGCTVCREDQIVMRIAGVPPFRICRRLAPELKPVLEHLKRDGIPLLRIVGYRPGRTRGDVDRNGNRTRYSNHAYGAAVDIDPGQNGLYDHCIRFGPQCRLIMGGPWQPGHDPASLTPDGEVVKAMRAIGLKWGGMIKGRQKDFMHFSVSGY